MAADGQIVFEIKGDDTKAKQSINNVTEALKKAGNQWETEAGKSTDAVGDKFSSMFKKISVAALAMKAGKALLDFGKDAVQAASDLQEVQNVVDVTFGEGNRKIEEWAKNASTQFGLTELQAKKFASTMGAMMKSSGLAGDQIETMSTDLAGLAADMASFYNLDFETAFSKIRSGISGMTMPLKELGIDMSVDTMNAFALKQGLEKTFAQMSQAEQTVLRYQYLMQATADAQGDFARTSDGLANTQRRLETAIDTLKTKMGEPLLNVVATATEALTGFINVLIPDEKKKTVLDDLNDIKIETDQKLADIQAIATKAGDLVSSLESINNSSGLSTDSNTLKYIRALTGDINALADETAKQPTITGDLTSLAGGLNPSVTGDGELAESIGGIVQSIGGLETELDTNGVAGKLEGLAGDLDPEVPHDIGDTLGGIKGEIDTFADDLTKTGVEAGMKALEGELNPDIGETTAEKKMGEVEGSIGSLENKLGDNTVGSGMSGLAGDLNPEVQGDFAGTVSGITESISSLESAVSDTGTLQQDVGGVADAINKLPGDSSKGDAVGAVAEGINKLKLGQSILWRSMYNVLSDIDGLSGLFSGNAAGNVSDLATALSEDAPPEEKARAWETFLNALGTNAGALSSLTGKDAEGAAAWLIAVKEALDQAKLDPNNVAAWTNLMGVFAEGMSEENKGAFTDTVVQELLAMGTQSDYAREQLLALGFSSDDIADAQQQWLIICQKLVRELPSLNSIINTQTGEIKGGTQAVEDYIDEWTAAQEKAALLDVIAKKRQALEARYGDRYDLKVDLITAQSNLDRINRQLDETSQEVKDAYEAKLKRGQSGKVVTFNDAEKAYMNLLGEQTTAQGRLARAQKEYNQYMADYDAALEQVNSEEEAIIDLYGEDEVAKAKAAAATEELVQEMSTLAKAATGDEEALGKVKSAVTTLENAMTALGDYQQKVREETASTLKQTITGFNEVISPATRARNEVDSLTAAIKAETDAEKKQALQRQLESAKKTAGEAPSLQSMQRGLESQLRFMQDYNDQLAKARALGVSNEILASLSDGSQESYDYLYAINEAMKGLSDEERIAKIKELNEAYKQVQTEAESFTNTLTDQKLTADEEFKSLVQSVQDAVGGLDMGETTYKYMEQTLQGIIDACGDKEAGIKAAVDGIKAQFMRLANLGFGANLTMGGNIRYRNSAVFSYAAPHANGIDYVPYDGYLALLHQGERIQTAAEADLSRRYANQQPGVDYAAAGAAMGAAMGRGNVYLDGRIVGDVIGSRQANSYRALERSGWQG